MKRLITFLILAAAIFAIYCAATGYRPAWLEPYWHAPVAADNKGRRFRNPDEAVAVLAVAVQKADVPVNVDAIGTAQPLNQVVVRSQIDGRLTDVLFKDGQDVKAGDVLAHIDATTFQAQYDQSVAKKAQDEAQLANALKDLERYRTLSATQYTSKQQADTQAATVAQLQAVVRYDAATLANSKAVLDYTTIHAPIDGRAGFRAVDPGNIIHAADAAGLVSLTQIKPIGVVFNLPQQHLQTAQQATRLAPLQAVVLDADTASELDRGLVTTIDNQVDPTTGSVKFRAGFPNARLQLWPGQFVNVRLVLSTLKDALTVPAVAVQRGPNGAFVYMVSADGKAVSTPVTVPRQDEKIAVIKSTLTEGQMVITSGFAQLKDGSKVTVGDAPPAPAKSMVAKPAADTAADPVKPDPAKPATDAAAPATEGTEPKKRRNKDAAGLGLPGAKPAEAQSQ